MKKKFVCTVCGYIHEGEEAPAQCPQCKAPASKFKELVDTELTFVTEHVIGIAKDVDPEIKKGLQANFEGECTEVGMYLAMSRQADREGSWNISVSYNFSYSRSNPYRSPTISQIINFSGDLSLTPKWKLAFQSGYDIKNKEVTSTSFSVTRDLHCWEMTFNCMPFGQHQSYNFEIHVRSSLLRDLKLTKRDSWYDRRL